MQQDNFIYDGFVFYKSFYEAIRLLPAESQARVYDAIMVFALQNIEVELSGAELAIFLLIKPQIIANRERRENGKKGGRPKTTEEKPVENGDYSKNDNDSKNQTITEHKPNYNQDITKDKPTINQDITESEPIQNQTKPNVNVNGNGNVKDNVNGNGNVKDNVNGNGNVKDNVNGNVKELGNKTAKKRFEKPTIKEIAEYCNERKNNIDPQKFFDFYESKGWRVGIAPMKDWQACVRNWEKSEKPAKVNRTQEAEKYIREE